MHLDHSAHHCKPATDHAGNIGPSPVPLDLRLGRIQVGSWLTLSYGYDAVGNVKSITDRTNSGQVQTFSYDSLDRLISASTTGVGNGQYSESYQYNPIGNISSTSRLGTYAYPASGPTSVRPHAATAAGSNSYTYDGNGNMLTRVEVSGTQRITYTQAWDIENRLSVVTNTVTLSVTRFYYDGDGKRVKKVESKSATSTTTVYVGAHYEKNITTSVTTTYYYAGATRVAMRQGGAVYYTHADHLGSASLTTDASGARYGELRYKPYGETRYIWGATPTDRRFTGQRSEEASLGSLYDFNARFYSPVLGRFVSADTIVPSPGNPQDLNRYSYARNNALKFSDPSGYDPWYLEPVRPPPPPPSPRPSRRPTPPSQTPVPTPTPTYCGTRIPRASTGTPPGTPTPITTPPPGSKWVGRTLYVPGPNGQMCPYPSCPGTSGPPSSRPDALGLRYDRSFQAGLGVDINVDVIFNSNSGELDLFISPGPAGGANVGSEWTAGVLISQNAPDNSVFEGTSVYGGADAPIWIPNTPLVVNVEVEVSTNQNGGPTTLYVGASPASPGNVEVGRQNGYSPYTFRFRLLDLY